MSDKKSKSKIDSLSEEILKDAKRLMLFNLFPCVEHLLILDIDGTLISQAKEDHQVSSLKFRPGLLRLLRQAALVTSNLNLLFGPLPVLHTYKKL